MASSLRTRNPWAKPRGMKNWRLFSPESSTATYLPKRGTRLADVDSHVDDAPADDADELGLRELAFLIVKATKNTVGTLRLVVLDKLDMTTDMLVEVALAVGLKEVTAVVVEHFGLEHPYSLNSCFLKLHFVSLLKYSGCDTIARRRSQQCGSTVLPLPVQYIISLF